MKNFILAFMMTIGLSASYQVIGQNKGTAVVYSAIPNNPTYLLFSIIGIYLFLTFTQKNWIQTNWLQKILSLFFAYCTWSLTIYQSGINSITQIISSNSIGILFSVLTIGSYMIILNNLQGIFNYYMEQPKTISLPKINLLDKVIDLFDRKPFLVSFTIISSFWLLVALSSFPSVFMGDSLDQVEQFLGIQTRTAAHPVLSTIFMGGFVKLGQLVGHPNIGIFFYTVSQLLLVSFLVSFSIKLVYDLTKKADVLLGVSLLVAILPSINGTVILATKDIIFSGFFVLYIVTLAIYFIDEKKFFKDKLWIAYSLSIIFMLLFRYNTIHFIGLSLIVYFIAEISSKKKLIRKTSVIMLTILVLIIGSGINRMLVSQFVEEGLTPKRREMLSLPFQQTARYINYHEDEISVEDKKIIENVLKYDVIKENYDPIRSDAVKRTHNEEATKEEMSDYFKLVVRQTLAHPLVTLESVTASHGNLFNVNRSLNSYYKNSVVLEGEQEGMMERYDVVGLSDHNIFLKLNKIRLFFYSLWDRLPLFSQINNYGVYMFVFLSLFILSLRKRRFDLAAIFIPLGAFVGTLIAGPITQGYLRYELPIMLVTPILFIIVMTQFKHSKLDELS
ncbi:DUF6020 family protein [Vagococcus fluvialis]|uniref:DUF6020 family protein n=1 Tax=Vagococcus fluvialis TaxID=2738 RepID=UPI0037A52B11